LRSPPVAMSSSATSTSRFKDFSTASFTHGRDLRLVGVDTALEPVGG
jgi:hypothetical protein